MTPRTSSSLPRAIRAIVAAALPARADDRTIDNRRHCARGGHAELAAMTAAVVQRLLDDSAARTKQALLDLQVSSQNTAGLLDGRPLGAGPRRSAIRTGKDELRPQRAGYRTTIRTPTARTGGEEIVSVALEHESDRGRDSDAGVIVPLMVVGGGVLGLVGGAHASLTATSTPVGLQEKYNYSTAGIGIAITGAVTVGAALCLRLRPSKKRSHPTLSALPRCWVAGWFTSLSAEVLCGIPYMRESYAHSRFWGATTLPVTARALQTTPASSRMLGRGAPHMMSAPPRCQSARPAPASSAPRIAPSYAATHGSCAARTPYAVAAPSMPSVRRTRALPMAGVLRRAMWHTLARRELTTRSARQQLHASR